MADHLSFDTITAIMWSRMESSSPLIRRMSEVRRRYDGEWIMAMPNLDEEPTVSPAGPALVADAVEHLALTASSLEWNISVPALDPAKARGKGSLDWANIRRKAMRATWFRNQGNLAIRTAYKHFVGYATCALIWCWDDNPYSRTYGLPRLLVRDPLTSFPEPKVAYDLTPPANVGFVATHSTDAVLNTWRSRVPDLERLLSSRNRRGVEQWDLVEWVDCEDVVIGLLGPHFPDGGRDVNGWSPGPVPWNGSTNIELTRYENLAHCVPGVCPQQVTMSKVASAVAKNTGQADLMNRMLALDVAASERDVFPDRYVLGHSSQQPELVGHERWQDGRTGNTNLVTNADSVGVLHATPSQAARQLTDRVERNFRVSTGLAPTWGAETYGSLRTGRGIDAMQGASTDPRVAELQETMQLCITELNRGMIALYKGHAPPGKSYTLFSGWAGDHSVVKFEPAVHFETDEQVVEYPVVGMSTQDLTIMLGQLYGAGAISLQTFRYLHPHIRDPEGEVRRTAVEKLLMAAIDSLSANVAKGVTPIEDLAEVGALVAKDGDVFAAVKRASELAQQRQAEAAQPPQPGPDGAPALGPGGQPLALPPGQMPGLGPPGIGMENQPPPEAAPPIGPPAASLGNLRQLVRDLQIHA